MGLFLTVEGPDGAGKTTQIELLRDYLSDKGYDIIVCREPGGTPISEAVRNVILNKEFTEMGHMTELLLYAAARAQLIEEVIRPALEDGKIVICDRFVESSAVYQGIARGMGIDLVYKVNQFAIGDTMPDLTIMIDLDAEAGISRKKKQAELDRMESETIDFHKKVVEGYRQLASLHPDRIYTVDGSLTIEEIHQKIVSQVNKKFHGKGCCSMKSFDAIIGHKKIISHFEEAIKTGKVSHAYLLSGEDGSGKMMIAKAVAKALLCEHKDGCGECAACKQVDSLNHPDVIYITHEKYEIRVDDIRKGINETIDIKPYSGDYKIYIIDDADRMNAGAQNALLKTLEEPPAYAVILLLTNNKDRLLDTILSRCVSMTLGSVRESEIEDYLKANTGASHADIAFAAAFSLGNIGRALHVLDTEEFKDMLNDTMNVITHMKSMEIYEVVSYAKSLTKYKNEIYDFLDIIMVWYRDMLILKTTGSLNQLVFKDKYRQLKDQEIYISFEGISHILDEVEKARRRLIANVNFEVAIEMLLVTIKENGKVW